MLFVVAPSRISEQPASDFELEAVQGDAGVVWHFEKPLEQSPQNSIKKTR